MKGGDIGGTAAYRALLRCVLSGRRALLALLLCAGIAAIVGGSAGVAEAAHATLSWTTPDTRTDGTPLSDLAGYKIYLGTASGSYGSGIDVGYVSSYFMDNLTEGATYYFVVTAYDSAGVESPFSNEVAMPFPAASSASGYAIGDALEALRYATGLAPLSSDQASHLDVAPLGVDGKPRPDGTVDVADAIIILKYAVGLLSW